MNSLKYTDEEDKSFGLAGMSIAAMVWDEIEAIESVSLDSEDCSSVDFASDYVYAAPAGVSVKSVWEQSFLHYRLCARLLMANVACREIVHRNEPVSDYAVRQMRRILAETGMEHCSLEQDETDMVFEKNYDSVIRIFNHSAVRQIARDFASELKEARRMSASEIAERLQRLRML